MNEENFLRLKRKKKVAKQNILSMQKRYSVQIDNMNIKIQKVDKECNDLESKLKEKETFIELLTQKVAEAKKTVKHNALSPIQNNTNTSMTLNVKFANSNKT
jgi:peptidoglycan hydrolase CwlO-like protein